MHHDGHVSFPPRMVCFIVFGLAAAALLLGCGPFYLTAFFSGNRFHTFQRLLVTYGVAAPLLFAGWPAWLALGRRRRRRDVGNISDGSYRAIVDCLESAVYILDANGNIAFWNGGAERSFGFTKEEATGSPPPHVPPEKANELYQILSAIENGNTVTELLTYRMTRDGSRVEVGVIAKPLDIRPPHHRHICVIETDVTSQREMEKTLRRSARLSGIGQLAAGMAHQLNTPLGTILLSVDAARTHLGYDTPSELQTVEAEARRCQETIRRLLAFSRDSSEQRQPLDLNIIAKRCAALWRDQIEQRGIKLETLLSEPCTADVDAHQLEEVVFNLLANAVDATPPMGKITIASERETETVSLIVRDTGDGIDDQIVANVFDPFFTTKDPDKGTGLGLYVCDQIVTSHGGSITVESAREAGTIFHITLPRSRSVITTEPSLPRT